MPNTWEPVLGKEFVLHTGMYGDSPCKVTELELPNRLSFDWDEDWHLRFDLEKLDDNKTKFTLIHSVGKVEKEKVREIIIEAGKKSFSSSFLNR